MLIFEKVGVHNFSRVPEPCRFCLYWQSKGEFQQEASKSEMEKAKLNWLGSVEKVFGNCVGLACLGSVPVGFMQYAPPQYFSRVGDYASGPPRSDAVFIACLYIVSKEHRGKGYGTVMLRNLLKELGPLGFYLKSGFKVVRQKG